MRQVSCRVIIQQITNEDSMNEWKVKGLPTYITSATIHAIQQQWNDNYITQENECKEYL